MVKDSKLPFFALDSILFEVAAFHPVEWPHWGINSRLFEIQLHFEKNDRILKKNDHILKKVVAF